jgi:hypothetical protein
MSSNQFDRLTDELILKITNYLYTSHIHLGDEYPLNANLWEFSLCNKRLRRIALPLLYRTINIPNFKCMSRFIVAIIQRPLHASLVKELALIWHHLSKDFTDIDLTYFVLQAIRFDLPLQLISHLNGNEPWVWDQYLLHFLPDLEVLHIELKRLVDKDYEYRLSEFLYANSVSTKLRVLFLDGLLPVNISFLIAATLCPSMNEVGTSMKILLHSEPGSQELYRQDAEGMAYHRTSNVERLELHNALLQATTFSEILRLPISLKKLIYRASASESSSQVPVLINFKQAIDSVADSLEYLELHWDIRDIDDRFILWSFNKFLSLKTFHISWVLMYGLKPTSTTRVTECLPPNLEVLGMYVPYKGVWTLEDYRETWRRLLIKKSAVCLPHLRQIGHFYASSLEILYPLVDLASQKDVEILFL